MTLVSVQGFAQIQRTAEFNFSNPLGLNPAITPPSGNNEEINITDKTFTNKDITIDFDLGNKDWVLPSIIYQYLDWCYYLLSPSLPTSEFEGSCSTGCSVRKSLFL